VKKKSLEGKEEKKITLIITTKTNKTPQKGTGVLSFKVSKQ